MILHLVNQSPLQAQALALCLRFASDDDVLLLLEDGVASAAVGSAGASLLQASPLQRVVALHGDVSSRGLCERLVPGIETIDYPEFVALCGECDNVQSWF